MGAIGGCVSGLLWAGEKTVTSVSGLLKFNKLAIAVYKFANHVFPQYTPNSTTVYHHNLSSPGLDMLESLSTWLALFNVKDKSVKWYRQGDFKTSIDLSKSLFGFGAESCTAYIAEQQIKVTEVSLLGKVARGFGAIPLFANLNAAHVRDRFFCGVALCEFISIGKALWTAYNIAQGNQSWWMAFGRASYEVLMNEKNFITLTLTIARLWSIFYPPVNEAKAKGLIIYIHGAAYYKYLRFD